MVSAAFIPQWVNTVIDMIRNNADVGAILRIPNAIQIADANQYIAENQRPRQGDWYEYASFFHGTTLNVVFINGIWWNVMFDRRDNFISYEQYRYINMRV